MIGDRIKPARGGNGSATVPVGWRQEVAVVVSIHGGRHAQLFEIVEAHQTLTAIACCCQGRKHDTAQQCQGENNNHQFNQCKRLLLAIRLHKSTPPWETLITHMARLLANGWESSVRKSVLVDWAGRYFFSWAAT